MFLRTRKAQQSTHTHTANCTSSAAMEESRRARAQMCRSGGSFTCAGLHDDEGDTCCAMTLCNGEIRRWFTADGGGVCSDAYALRFAGRVERRGRLCGVVKVPARSAGAPTPVYTRGSKYEKKVCFRKVLSAHGAIHKAPVCMRAHTATPHRI